MSKGKKIYTRLKMLRMEKNISRKKMGEILGVHYQTIGYIERGEYMPALDIALNTASFFDLPVETIFSLKPFPSLADKLR